MPCMCYCPICGQGLKTIGEVPDVATIHYECECPQGHKWEETVGATTGDLINIIPVSEEDE